jgi:6-phosphofructokinase 1
MASLPDNLTAVLFSGGDAPGMNSLLRAIVRLANNRYSLSTLGILDGYKGLVRTTRRLSNGELTLDQLKHNILERRGQEGLLAPDQDLVLMTNASVTGAVVQGGILLRSARCKEFRAKPELRLQVINMLKELGVQNLIVCGGDGSLAGARALVKEGGLKVVGIPSTIDNDLPVTEMALGVHSAVATVVWAVDHFKDTARSHRRVMVLETMGRESGVLTQLAAIASGAEYAIIPEEGKLTHDRILHIAREVEAAMLRGRTHTIILIAEGVKFEPQTKEYPAFVLARELERYFSRNQDPDGDQDVEVRPSVLGHMQRGGRPDPADAILAAQFAEAAWDAIVDNKAPSGVVAMRDGRVRVVPFESTTDHRDESQWRKTAALHRALSGW